MKKIAIIGGHGFIGKNFSTYFIEKGYTVTLVGRNSGNTIFQPEVQSIIANIQETLALVEAVKSAEVVIWLASSLIPGSNETSLEVDFDTNIKPVISFLEKANETSMKKFIYLSSGGTVYGDSIQRSPISEIHHKSPISEYGLSKLVTENYIQFITQNSNFESYVLRPSNVFGRFQNLTKPQGIIGFAFKSIICHSTIDLYNDGKVVRDFIAVQDLANAVFNCIEKPSMLTKTNIYNVGSGEGVTIKEMIDYISKIAGKEVQTISKSSRNFDCEYNVLNIDKIKKELKWEPLVDLNEGLKEIWEWINEGAYD